jgi:glycosyltransferase involved in cell wall biosynthesis
MYRSAKSKNPYSISRRVKFAYLIKRADGVIAGNAFLKSEALRHNDHVVTIPTPLDLSRYRLKEHVLNDDVVTIGWLGSRSSLRYLRSLLPTLERIFQRHPGVRLKIVCSEFLDSSSLPIVKKQWSWEEEEEDLRSFDIGVMPLSNDLWSKGKCGLKILQYYSVGVPVVCTPVGINQDIVTHGVNGFWALNEGQWEEGLVALVQDKALKEMGLRGRETVERHIPSSQCSPAVEMMKSGGSSKDLGRFSSFKVLGRDERETSSFKRFQGKIRGVVKTCWTFFLHTERPCLIRSGDGWSGRQGVSVEWAAIVVLPNGQECF